MECGRHSISVAILGQQLWCLNDHVASSFAEATNGHAPMATNPISMSMGMSMNSTTPTNQQNGRTSQQDFPLGVDKRRPKTMVRRELSVLIGWVIIENPIDRLKWSIYNDKVLSNGTQLLQLFFHYQWIIHK